MGMRRKAYCVMVAVCLAAFGFVGTGTASESAKESTAKNPAKGSHEARTYRSPDSHLKPYRAVFIENASVDVTSKRNKKVENFLNEMQGTVNASLLQALQASGRFETITTRKGEAKAKGKYLICRSDVLVHFGSSAARFLIGMGAGRSKLVVVNSLEDPETGEVVLKYTGWGGALGGFGHQITSKMRADAMSISQYFGNLVRSLPK